MSEVFQTFNIPASLVATAVKITDALQNGHQGMFQSFFKDGAELGSDGDTPTVYVSTGYISDQSPIILWRTAMTEALADTDVTAQEISDFMDALDLTGDAPLERAQALDAERGATVSAADWTQGTYPKGAIAKHNGETWRSLIDGNVWEPGVAAWRIVWGTATDTPPAWVQPSGSTDFYSAGERVSHSGSTWVSNEPVNVWEPGVFGWTEEVSAEPDVPRWVAPTGAHDAYSIGDEVIHDNPNDGGADWLYRSNIAANTTEPGRDGTFDRWWLPVESV